MKRSIKMVLALQIVFILALSATLSFPAAVFAEGAAEGGVTYSDVMRADGEEKVSENHDIELPEKGTDELRQGGIDEGIPDETPEGSSSATEDASGDLFFEPEDIIEDVSEDAAEELIFVEDAPEEPVFMEDAAPPSVQDEAILANEGALVDVVYTERSWDGTKVVTERKIHGAVPVPDNGNMTSGWYYLNKNVTKDGRIESITGDVNLILFDGYTLNVKGLYVPPNTTLTIYGRDDETGKIYSHPSGGAGIGGYSGHDNGNIVINGGTIDVEGHDHCAGIGSNDGQTGGAITIYGGNITAKSGSDGAAIGGGRHCPGGSITIYGGDIKCNKFNYSDQVHENGAGIGGGDVGSGGNITIWGGKIVTYSKDGAGIGGGDDGRSGNISINGGDIICWVVEKNRGRANGAGIGSGCDADVDTITINGGQITTHTDDGAGIGSGFHGNNGTIIINGGTIGCYGDNSDNAYLYGARIGSGADRDGGRIIINGGWINVEFGFGAGIGGGINGKAGDITINGGHIQSAPSDAHPNGGGAAIGCGQTGDGGNITINGGVILLDNVNGTGIGHGYLPDGPKNPIVVNISGTGSTTEVGATVHNNYAIGATEVNIRGKVRVVADGYKGGISGKTGTCNISGDDVTLGGYYNKSNTHGGSGIKLESSDAVVNITGGNVKVKGSGTDPGISLRRGTINISGGTVDVQGSEGPAISGQSDSPYGKLVITGDDTVVTVRTGIGKDVDAAAFNWRDFDHNGFRFTAGRSELYSRLLAAEEKNSVNQNKDYAYVRIEPCDHVGTVGADGKCTACGHYEAVSYVERSWNGAEVVSETKTHEAMMVLGDGKLTGGWYYLDKDVTGNGRIESITGDVNLILKDGCTFDVQGLYVPPDTTLTVYGQSGGTGRLYSHPSGGGAAIGGYSMHDNGNIVIHGGTIEAKGDGNCAGIGSNDSRTGGYITIYGGTVKATGGSNGAGIGGGLRCSGGNVTIYGGNITALGGSSGAGIGIGANGSAGTILIADGQISASVINAGSGGTVTLGSNPESSTISITAAAAYGGTVILNQGMRNNNNRHLFPAGRVPDNSRLTGTLIPWDGTVSTWAELQSAISNAPDNTPAAITVNNDLVAASGDTALQVGSAKILTIDLKGYSLDRGLSLAYYSGDPGTNGSLFVNSGTLTITSSASMSFLIGGYDTTAGCIRNEGTLTLDNLYISGNHAGKSNTTGHGGGICNTGTLTMTGCEIIDNTAGLGGGIYNTGTVSMTDSEVRNNSAGSVGSGIWNDGTLKVQGEIWVSGNDVYLKSGRVITLTGPLTGESKLYVSTEYNTLPVTITGGYSAQQGNVSPRNYFYVYNEPSDRFIGLSNGEVVITNQTYTVTFDSAGGSPVPAAQTVESGAAAVRPDDPVKEEYSFEGWKLNGEDYDFNAPVTGDIELKAEWKYSPVVVIKGVTATFNDRIKLNYYFDIPASLRNNSTAYVALTNKETGDSVTLPIKDAELIEGNGYKFSIPLAAKEACDTISAKAYLSEDSPIEIRGTDPENNYTETGVKYSLMQYFTWLENNGTDAKEKAVGAAVKDYCAAAQIYFGYHSEGLAVSSAVVAVTEDMLSSYIAGRQGTLPNGVSIRGITAMLEADNTLRLYLNYEDGVVPAKFTYMIDGKTVTPKQRKTDNSIYLALSEGVRSNRLQEEHTYSISDGSDTYTITASVLTYARACAARPDKTESDLGKALYLYNKAAAAAFGS